MDTVFEVRASETFLNSVRERTPISHLAVVSNDSPRCPRTDPLGERSHRGGSDPSPRTKHTGIHTSCNASGPPRMSLEELGGESNGRQESGTGPRRCWLLGAEGGTSSLFHRGLPRARDGPSAFGLSPPAWRQVIPVSTTLALLLAILPRNEIVFAISKCASR